MKARRIFFAALLMVLIVEGTAAQPFLEWRGLTVATYNDNSPFLYWTPDGNLNVGIGRGPDDQFTAGGLVSGQANVFSRWADALSVSLNYAMYTDTQYYSNAIMGFPTHSPWREDVMSLLAQTQKKLGYWSLLTGVGVLIRGNLGGQSLQDSVHLTINDQTFNLPYASFGVGPLVTAGVSYRAWSFHSRQWSGQVQGWARGVWDVLGVGNSQADFLAQTQIFTGAVSFDVSAGWRASNPGSAPFLASMYSGGFFEDSSLNFDLGGFSIRAGYAVNPYGAAPISQYPAYHDMNQEFHWSITWGTEDPLPWILRFYP